MNEIAVRCYAKPIRSQSFAHYESEAIEPIRVLVFDTETTTDVYQNLTFGSYRVYDRGLLQTEGLFYAQDLNEKQKQIVLEYGQKHGIAIVTRQEFVDNVFYPEVYDLQTLCLGFNLPYDLSRLAIHCGDARHQNKGAFSFQLSEDPHRPRIIIKHLDRNKSFNHFSSALPINKGNNRNRTGSRNYRGRLLDAKTFAFALTGNSYSLKRACEYFGADVCKFEVEEHGKVTSEYIDYNRNDVTATYSLFLKELEAVKKYHVESDITKLYSPASIGKDYLHQMGITSFIEKNPNFSPHILGALMQTFYGGRAEVKIRKQVVKIRLLDFLSMYPTICICQDVWSYVISDHIEQFNSTKETREFLDKVNLDTFSDPISWKKLNTICLVQPNDDILPIRSKYGNNTVFNIGINRLTSEQPLWYSLADVAASKLLTGRPPKILKAISFVPSGVQSGLRNIKIVGGREIVPTHDDLFKSLMEYRNEVKTEMIEHASDKTGLEYCHLDTIQKATKTITNAVSYGIFLQINSSEKQGTKIRVHSGNDSFTTEVDRVEEFGHFFNPIIATMITSGARLVLAITEAILMSEGKCHAFCDTDSMAVPEESVKRIQEYFQKISPYSFEASLFKLEKENFGHDGKTLEDLFFYGISAKRYALFTIRDGKVVIKKPSSHGLGHLLNPFKSIPGKDWHEVVWQDIINDVVNNDGLKASETRYSGHYSLSQITISSPDILRRFKKLNQGKVYSHQIKPFNFALVGTASTKDSDTSGMVKPITPFNKNFSKVPYVDFIDYNSGRVLNGCQYWKTLDLTYWDYKNHSESKFAGTEGILERRHIRNPTITYIGKESNRLEESEIMGVEPDDYNVYISREVGKNSKKEFLDFIVRLNVKEAARYNISAKQLRRMRAKIASNSLIRLSKNITARLMLAWEANKKKTEKSSAI